MTRISAALAAWCIAALPTAVSAANITIMTQNMDEGTDYQALAAATNLPDFVVAVTHTYQDIAATAPATRADAMAQQIATQHPDLVALQEASIVRTGNTVPATTVTSDLLGSLMSRLAVLGQHYAPVVIGTGLDAQAPSTLGFDVRLTTQDVILARTDRPTSQFNVSNPQAHQFATQLAVPTPAGPIALTRGWASVDATVQGRSFRFVTTHLDTGQFGPAIQLAQAQELLTTVGSITAPVIYAGDFNSSADDPTDPTYATYAALREAGLGDAWAAAHPGDPGFTCCEDPDLLNPDPQLTQRIDLTLFTAPFGVEDAHLVGISPSDKTGAGLWPSDHAGLVVTFDLPVPEPAPMGLFMLGLAALGAVRCRGRRSARTLVLTLIASAAALPASAASYSALYAFGDSLSDTGNVFAATAGAEPASPYFAGRFSNGPVWVEGLSAKLGLGAVSPSLLGGNDYATGGAQTGATPVHSFSVADLPAQRAQFAASHPVAPSGALYTLAIGANDMFSLLQASNPVAVAPSTIAAAVSNVDAMVIGLAAAGARHFLVMTVPDLGLTPAVTAFGPAASSLASALTASFDTSLVTSLDALAAAGSLDVRTLDAYSLLDHEVADPALFGFSDVTNPCWSGDFFGVGGSLCGATVAQQNTHLFWDAVHPTEVGHAVLADAALRLIPEPGSMTLLASGLVCLALRRRRRA